MSRFCIICSNFKPETDYPEKFTDACTHEASVCSPCAEQWIESQFEWRSWDAMACPQCGEVMKPNDIKGIARTELFAKYERLMTRAASERIPNFRWCLSPDCDSGQVHDVAKLGPCFTCESCEHRACAVHNVPWHEGMTCSEYNRKGGWRKKKRDDVASKTRIALGTKQCPKCQAPIEKKGGCDHMTCLRCRSEFCWRCHVEYPEIRLRGKKAHRWYCRHFTIRFLRG